VGGGGPWPCGGGGTLHRGMRAAACGMGEMGYCGAKREAEGVDAES
jgi:hypothetical protein